jgi:hypothetical protein
MLALAMNGKASAVDLAKARSDEKPRLSVIQRWKLSRCYTALETIKVRATKPIICAQLNIATVHFKIPRCLLCWEFVEATREPNGAKRVAKGARSLKNTPQIHQNDGQGRFGKGFA